MQLTPKQTASLLEARTCLLARLMEIIQGRKSIISMLKVKVTCHDTPRSCVTKHAACRDSSLGSKGQLKGALCNYTLAD